MPRLFRATILTCICLLLACCTGAEALNATVSHQSLIVQRDQHYGPDDRQTLDIYRDTTKPGPLPVMVFFYGGGWRHGSKDDFLFAGQALARRGMLVFMPNYRLYPDVHFPDFVEDAASAVAFARKVAPSWGGDPDRVFVAGHSSGAHLAAMVTLDPEYLAAAGDSRDRLAGAIGLAGPYNFLPIQDPAVADIFAGTTDLSRTQPITYANGRNPPMLLLAGGGDETVLPQNTIDLAARIRANGGPVESKIYPDIGHLGIVIALSGLFRSRADTLDDMAMFVNAH